ncbi:MAG: acetate--CoA ligase family protein [Chloroflexi bacterium]|nr:acetate--CoA ligase family protein [Chloroflexota bacterium]
MSVESIVAVARKENRTLLTEVEAKQVLREAGVTVVETKLAKTKAEAQKTAKEMGYPVVLKIVSPDIVHKSDIGGVKLGLADDAAVGKAFDEVMAAAKKASPSANIHGVSVQPMAKAGTEVIIGMSKDPQFGPVMMFGLGGILVEVLKDVAFRVVPLTARDASQMVHDIKAYKVLEGYRGQDPADVASLEKAILSVSAFVEKHPEIKELDLNPVFAYKKGIAAVDARIVLEQTA